MIVPRDAATLMLLREGGGGLEVLMLRRNLASSWLGGVYLFPGGAVEEADATLAGRSPARDDEEASRLLGLTEGGLAFYVAAIRECFEEAGVLLASCRAGRGDFFAAGRERRGEARRALNAGELSFAAFLEKEDLVLETGRLSYFSHWITPEGSPRRYDTRFFVAALPEGETALHDDVEVIDSTWIAPEAALERHEAGEIDLLLPTARNLESLSRFGSPEEVIAAADRFEVPTVLPKVSVEGEGVRILLPGEEGYEEAGVKGAEAAFPDRSQKT